jgi:C-terminal processing protease CtpA/Prc
VIDPLTSGLASRRANVGKIYALIGPYTFSSALDNALKLHKELSAILVGEPTGGAPNGYGEVRSLRLPNSKLVVRFTTKRWGPAGGANTTLNPDLLIPFKLSDFIAGHDPALDAAIAAR